MSDPNAVGGEADRIAALLDERVKDGRDSVTPDVLEDAASLLRSQALEIQKAQAERDRFREKCVLMTLRKVADEAVNGEGLDWYGEYRPNQVVGPVVAAIWTHLQAALCSERVAAALAYPSLPPVSE